MSAINKTTGAFQRERGNITTAADPAGQSESVAATLPQPSKPFLSEKELLATVLPISRRSLFTYREKGLVPCVIVGKRRLYHVESVIAALLRLQRGTE